MDTATSLSAVEACEVVGVSYRQLDYWARAGYLTALGGAEGLGSGSRRRFTPHEVAVLAVIAAVSGVVRISHLAELCHFLAGWPHAEWDGTVLMIDADGHVWTTADGGRPPVAVGVDLGAILARLPG